MSAANKHLIVVGGPTASGKTTLAIHLAKQFNTEILSADSRQFYQELNIGVARPSVEELTAAKHHFIGHKSIHDYYSAGEFERDAIKLLDSLFQKHDVVVMVGGSGLFINAVLHGFHESPKDDGSVRKKIEETYNKNGLSSLTSQLKSLDPAHYEVIDTQNPQRVMRALERIMLSGKTMEEQTKAKRKARSFTYSEIAIDHPREQLYSRINQRVDMMMEAGLLEEVRALVPHKELNALQTVGYSELFSYLAGEISIQEATDLIKQNTRRYAKRQITWFKNKTGTVWFELDGLEQIISQVVQDLGTRSKM